MPDAPPSAAEAFDGLSEEFFGVWFRYHPESALAVGVDDYGELLAPESDDEQAALASLLEAAVVALEELDHDALDRNRRLDAELLFGLARVEYQELLEHDWRRRDPLAHLPLLDVHRLTLLRPPSLRSDLLSLLTLTPAHLRLALAQLLPMAELIPPPLVSAAISAAEAGPAYLRELARSRWLRTYCHGSAEIELAAESASAALLQFANGLREDIAPRAAGRLAGGAERLELLLRHRHHLPLEREGIADQLERLLDAATPRRASGAREDAVTGSREATSSAGQTADGIAAECTRQRRVLLERQTLTPPSASLQIAGGPACPGFRQDRGSDLPSGIDYMPDLRRGAGALYVADGESCKSIPTPLIRRCCANLGWSGLHTLTFAGGPQARSLLRLLADGASLTKGLPLSLAGHLFGRDAPETVSARQHALQLAKLDLDLHLERISDTEASTRAASLGEPDAVLTQLIRHPGEALATVVGWRLIDAARAQLVCGDQATIDEREFHDRLVANGPIPAAAAVSTAFGAPLLNTLVSSLTTG
jgi:hypothetical protein